MTEVEIGESWTKTNLTLSVNVWLKNEDVLSASKTPKENKGNDNLEIKHFRNPPFHLHGVPYDQERGPRSWLDKLFPGTVFTLPH